MNNKTPVEYSNNTSALLWDTFKMTIQDTAPRRLCLGVYYFTESALII